jgi:hypothetical protein
MADETAEQRIAALEVELKELWKCVDDVWLTMGRKPPRWPERLTAGESNVEIKNGHILVGSKKESRKWD